MATASSTLAELRQDFLATRTNAMPIAGMLVWGALGVAAFMLPDRLVGILSLYIMVGILPIAFLIERVQGRNLFAGGDNPLVKLFLSSIAMIGAIVPLIIVAANVSQQPLLVLLGMAILAGVIWIPYGWAADDPVGMQHAIGRTIGCYCAYAFAPDEFIGPAICAVVVVSYAFTLLGAKKMGGPA